MHLVDLAGSEKISKTQATGETLEEAKKINLSLSALGNVIHALANKSEHIPYRDSKLTRLLSESLGGNFKTSLIAACNPTSRNIEETISTLKFAQRAKIVKNSIKMNIKTQSSQGQDVSLLKKQLKIALEQVQKLQQQLKLDLTKSQSASFFADLLLEDKFQQNQNSKATSCKKQAHQYSIKQANLVSTQKRQISLGSVLKDPESPNSSKCISLTPQGSPKQQNVLKLNCDEIKEVAEDLSQEKIESTQFEEEEEDQQEALLLQIQTKDQTIKQLQIENSSLQEKLKEYEVQIEKLHKENIILEIQNSNFTEKFNSMQNQLSQETSNKKQVEVKNEMLQNHIEQLTEALENCDGEYFKLLNTNFFNFLDQSQLQILEFLEKLSQENNFNAQAFKCFKNAQVVTEVQHIMQKSKYGQELVKQLEGISNLNQDSEKYFLKSGLYNNQYVNLQLKRAISALEWRQSFLIYTSQFEQRLNRILKQQVNEMWNLSSVYQKQTEELRNLVTKALQFDYNFKQYSFGFSQNKFKKKSNIIRSVLSSEIKLRKENEEIPKHNIQSQEGQNLKHLYNKTVSPFKNSLSEIDGKANEVQCDFSSPSKLLSSLEFVRQIQQFTIDSSCTLGQTNNDFDFQEWANILNEKQSKLENELELWKQHCQIIQNSHCEVLKENEKLKQICKNLQQKSIKIALKEQKEWQKLCDNIRANLEQELFRKQLEVVNLNEKLAEWMDKQNESNIFSGSFCDQINMSFIKQEETGVKCHQRVNSSTSAEFKIIRQKSKGQRKNNELQDFSNVIVLEELTENLCGGKNRQGDTGQIYIKGDVAPVDEIEDI